MVILYVVSLNFLVTETNVEKHVVTRKNENVNGK